MSEIKVTITGLDQLEQRLRNESKLMAKRLLRRAEKDAAKIWVEAISERAPAKTGYLKTHIVMSSVAKGGIDGGIQVMVGGDKKAFYGIFAEFGTRYQKATPFMRPAFEQTKQQVLDAFVADLKDELNTLKR
jgi:HK97 gp10 family phage protein